MGDDAEQEERAVQLVKKLNLGDLVTLLRAREREELGLNPRLLAEISGWRGLEAGQTLVCFLRTQGMGCAALTSSLWPVKEVTGPV